MSDADCIFCKIVAGEIPGDVVHTTERTVAFRDLNPQAPTHVLVVPKDALRERRRAGRRATRPRPPSCSPARRPSPQADGHDSYRMVFNTGADAGQTVFHAHLHVLAGPMTGWPA